MEQRAFSKSSILYAIVSMIICCGIAFVFWYTTSHVKHREVQLMSESDYLFVQDNRLYVDVGYDPDANVFIDRSDKRIIGISVPSKQGTMQQLLSFYPRRNGVCIVSIYAYDELQEAWEVDLTDSTMYIRNLSG